MKLQPVACLVVVACLAAGAGWTQSLAEIAKKGQDRQKTVKEKGKSYTDQDLSKFPAPAPPPDAAAQPGVPSPNDPAAKPGDASASRLQPGEDKGEAYWRGLLADARTKLERNRAQLGALQQELDSFDRVWIDRDDYDMRLRVEKQRSKVLADVERLKKEIDDGVKEIERIKEDARRQGVPPGWLR